MLAARSMVISHRCGQAVQEVLRDAINAYGMRIKYRTDGDPDATALAATMTTGRRDGVPRPLADQAAR